MFGEGLGGLAQGGPRDFAWSWMGVGAAPIKFGLAPGGGAGTTNGGSELLQQPAHRDRPDYGMGDGPSAGSGLPSTGIRNPAPTEEGDWWVLQYMAGKADGKVYDASKLGELTRTPNHSWRTGMTVKTRLAGWAAVTLLTPSPGAGNRSPRSRKT